ncbi:cell wall-binding repeat-containing protein [Ornithinimicrobium pratense]|nr:cell wall-binding repeat-containing protein [Ornithinimicrobium pratense]
MALNRRRSTRAASALAGLALVAAGLTPATALPTSPGSSADGEASLTDEYDIWSAPEAAPSSDWEGVASDTGLWIVRLAGPSVAAYTATLEARGTASDSQVASFDAQLEAKHTELVDTIDATLGRAVNVEFSYRNVLNGMAVEITEAEAEQLRELPGVIEVYPDTIREMDTDVSHEILLSEAVWNGETGTDEGTRGEGVVIGFIDSGVNPFHPSFAETDMDGYTHTNPYGEGVYRGVCADPSANNYEDICNDKLIGAYNLNAASSSAIDTDGHGSHVGSTIAGNKHEAEFEIGADTFERLVQGVAPRANAVSYLVCSPGCPGAASIAAVNNAITDGVDVLNYSISGSDFPWNDPVDLAFRDAAAAGINVVASAGNAGPGASTVAKTGPWMASTAATTHQRVFAQSVSVAGPTPVPEMLTDMPGFPGAGPVMTEDITAEVRSAADLGNFRACTPLPAGSMSGAIAFIERGDCPFPDKVNNAAAAGAVAVLMGNNFGGPPIAPGGLEGTSIPTVLISGAESQALLDFFASTDAAVTATIDADVELFLNEDWIDIVAGFSSRGPSQYDMLAPTYAAPGVNILAAAEPQAGNDSPYAILQGTSMSSPHAAGATALMRGLHPDWTPTEIRSALAASADTDLVKDNGVTPADPFDIGSGRINLSQAGRIGLVLDESIPNMIAANPAVGGDPATLNLPAMVRQDCAGLCSWTRTVTNVADVEAEYTAATTGAEGLSIQVTPAQFTLAAGESQEVVITATTVDTQGAWAFGSVTFSTDANHSSGADIADASLPVALKGTAAVADITVDPSQIDSTQAPDEVTTHELTIGNTGGAPLTWEFVDEAGTGVVFEQAEGGTSGIVSDYGNGAQTGVYSADDFVVGDATEISSIYTPGFWNTGSLTQASQISWRIYADAGGVPASHPEAGDDAVWAYDAAPTAAEVDITDNNITLDVSAAASTLDLEAGTYWLSVYPSIPGSPTSTSRWNWYQGTPQNGAPAKLVDPSNLFGGGFTSWTTLPVDWAVSALAFRLEGPLSCGADWVSVSPMSGTTAPGGTTGVEVSLDSTGVDEGTYTAQLCLESNDPDESPLTIPVTMTVEVPEPAPAINVMPESLSNSQEPDTQSEHTVTIANDGDQALEWDLAEAEAAPPAAGSPVTLPQGSDRASGVVEVDGQAPAQVLPTFNPLATDSLMETFDDIDTLPGEGWAIVNNSEPVGGASWFQGNPDVFDAHEGAADAYVGVNFNSAGLAPGHISNWLMTPELELTNDSTLSFWTRTAENPALFADRLEVRLSTNGASTNAGTGANGVGDFTTHLLSVNENLTATGYPAEWTNYEVTIEGLDAATTGRIGFRYWVPDGGPLGDNSSYIGIDTVSYEAADVEPNECEIGTDIPWMSASPMSGTTAPGGSSEVTVTLDSSSLDYGTYEAQLCVFSNDPENPLVRVPVTLEVADAPVDPVEPIEVERWSGTNRYGTAAAVSGTYEPGADVVFLATGLDYPDALTGSALAGSMDAPVLLTRKGALPNSTIAELGRLAPERVVVLGGPDAVADAVLVQAAALTGASVERLSGTNRYGTAAAVAAEFGTADRVFVATGVDYPDALSAAARAGALDSPVLLVRQASIPSATAAALSALAPSQITVLGGEGAVDQSVVRELRQWAPTQRQGGLNRWITSARIFADVVSAETVYVASGQDWPDALAGGAKAGSDHEPLLLTRKGELPTVIANAILRLDPERAVVLGGTNAVSNDVVEELEDLRGQD